MVMFEKFRGNLEWYKNVIEKKFSWNSNNKINLKDKKMLEQIDIYNFEIKTHNIINKLKIDDFPKNIPIIILWSPYYDTATKISKDKVNIIKKMNKKLNEHGNITCLFMNAPHQIERVIPITLSNFIINTTIK